MILAETCLFPVIVSITIAACIAAEIIDNAVSKNQTSLSKRDIREMTKVSVLDPTNDCGLKPIITRIYDGTKTEEHEWPWMAALILTKSVMADSGGEIPPGFICGGVLISTRHVLTAAHCLEGAKTATNLEVWLGAYKVADPEVQGPEVRHQVSLAFKHPRYNGGVNQDIGLIFLKTHQPITDWVRPACLPTSKSGSFQGAVATLVGWGYYDHSHFSPVLLTTSNVVISDRYCRRLVPYGFADQGLLCTAPTNSQTACHGDSGGPLMLETNDYRWQVIALVNVGTCQSNNPTGFARVTSYLRFIDTAVRIGEILLST